MVAVQCLQGLAKSKRMRGAESLSQLDISINNGTMTLNITTFSISALSIMTLIMTQPDGLICETQHKRIECPGADCCNAECRVFIVRLNVVMPSVVITTTGACFFKTKGSKLD